MSFVSSNRAHKRHRLSCDGPSIARRDVTMTTVMQRTQGRADNDATTHANLNAICVSHRLEMRIVRCLMVHARPGCEATGKGQYRHYVASVGTTTIQHKTTGRLP